MKFSKTSYAVFTLLVLFTAQSCKEPTREELIVGTWKFGDMKFPDAQISEEEKIAQDKTMEIFKNVTQQYFKDMTYETSFDIEGTNKKLNGTYKLEADGKYISNEGKDISGKNISERNEILTLNEDSLVLKSRGNITLILLRGKEK